MEKSKITASAGRFLYSEETLWKTGTDCPERL